MSAFLALVLLDLYVVLFAFAPCSQHHPHPHPLMKTNYSAPDTLKPLKDINADISKSLASLRQAVKKATKGKKAEIPTEEVGVPQEITDLKDLSAHGRDGQTDYVWCTDCLIDKTCVGTRRDMPKTEWAFGRPGRA